MKSLAQPGWLDQLEHSAEILRRASLGAWLLYLAGMLPFVLVLLYYLLEMLQSPYAHRDLPGLSLAVSLAFLWKQCWQAAFVARLRDELAGETTPWTRGRIYHLVTRQCFWQPLALLVLPGTLLAVAPFPLALAFFREIALLAGRGERTSFRAALRATVGEMKPHAFALAGFALLGLMLWVNLLITIIVVPQLGQSFFGIVTDWSRMGSMLANRVITGVAAVFTWMVLDPLLDAFYLQRSFRRESRQSGADLQAALRRVAAVAASAMLLLLVPAMMRAQEPAPALPAPAPSATVQALDPQQIDQAARQVLSKDDYAWRSRVRQADEGPILRWFHRAGEWIQEKVDGFFDWLRKATTRDDPGHETATGAGQSLSALEWLLYGLSAVIVVLALVLFFRAWQRSRALAAARAPAPPVARVDVADESVGADALEETAWLGLADELIAQGDYRLALRALHLAGLRYLGGKGHVSLARWKSGYEYQRELQRRLRAEPLVAQLFGGNLLRFEMVWYGRHAATPESIEAARDAWKEIRTHAS